MPMIISTLLGGILQLMTSLVGRVLLALGLGFVEYVGLQTLFSSVSDYATQAMAGFEGSSLIAWAGFFHIDVHVSILISAITIKMIFNGLNGGTVRKLIQK